MGETDGTFTVDRSDGHPLVPKWLGLTVSYTPFLLITVSAASRNRSAWASFSLLVMRAFIVFPVRPAVWERDITPDVTIGHDKTVSGAGA